MKSSRSRVGEALQKFGAGLAEATEVPEGEDGEEGEVDRQARLKAVKEERAAFQEEMKGILSEEQYATMEEHVDSVISEMFNDIGEIKAMDMQPILELSDEQVTALGPVYGTAMRDMMGVLYEYGDKKLNKRTKIKMGKKLKGIQGDMNKGMGEILSEEQIGRLQRLQGRAEGEAGGLIAVLRCGRGRVAPQEEEARCVSSGSLR